MTSTTLPKTMQAATFTSTSGGMDKHISITSIPLPKEATSLPSGSVLIKVTHSSLNPFEYKLAESPAGRFAAPKPSIPGADYAGTVVESKRADLKPGDRVYGTTKTAPFGALAQYIVNDGDARVVKVPEGLSLADASTIGIAGVTVWKCLVPYVKAGDRVLINGASGGTGSFAVQVAKALGCEVTAVCSTANVDLVKGLGADRVVDYKVGGGAIAQLKASSAPFDHILDCIFADPQLYFQSHHYLKKGGVFVTIALSPSLGFARTMLHINLRPGFLGGGKRTFKLLISSPDLKAQEDVAKWMVEGKVKVVVAETFPLAQAAEGYRKLKTGRTKGKIVIKVADE